MKQIDDTADYRTLTDEIKRIRDLLKQACDDTTPLPRQAFIHDNKQGFIRLNHIQIMFGLTDFERDTLLLCLACQLDETTQHCCQNLAGPLQIQGPTLRLAMKAFDTDAWEVLSPSRPLRAFRLIEFDQTNELPDARMRIDERILNYLNGTDHLDQRLFPYVQQGRTVTTVAPSLVQTIENTLNVLTSLKETEQLPAIQCAGDDPEAARAVAWHVCKKLKAPLYYLDARDIPATPPERHSFCILWQREIMLCRCALFIDCSDYDHVRMNQPLTYMLNMLKGLVFIHAIQPLAQITKPFLTIACNKPQPREQQLMFERLLGKEKNLINGHTDAVSHHFRLGTGSIVRISHALKQHGRTEKVDAHAFWDLCRSQSIPSLGSLAQRIEPKASWNDLVLPKREMNILRTITCHVRNRLKVYQQWGFSEKSYRGLGVSALFCGVSGTGKTMAAEVLAQDLRLDLYRIDLSSVVNKYVGETEKNLRRVFDAAEEGGALLLFDEADALFGKRSEIKDSHDRYANIEVSYLLQRMENYRGLAILTTNMKNSLDEAFLRRIRFIIDFPFPSAELREQIWKTVFPGQTKRDTLNFKKLAKLNVTGGSIYNIALNAAFLAADKENNVGMDHLYDAACSEYAKLGKPLTQSETSGWIK